MKKTKNVVRLALLSVLAGLAFQANASNYTMRVSVPGAKGPNAQFTGKLAVDFAYTGAIDTSFIVPGDGTYTLEVWGGQGGYQSGYVANGAFGAYMKCAVALTGGTHLKILVGGAGTTTGGNGGAAGGTFIATADNTPLAVAGGGGGGWAYYGGAPGTATNNGTTLGGQTASYGNGGGFTGDGAGKSFINGGAPGTGGGFGGGGGYGGGGGGYNGGSSNDVPNNRDGQGGGSYCGGKLFTGTTGAWGNPTAGGTVISGKARISIN